MCGRHWGSKKHHSHGFAAEKTNCVQTSWITSTEMGRSSQTCMKRVYHCFYNDVRQNMSKLVGNNWPNVSQMLWEPQLCCLDQVARMVLSRIAVERISWLSTGNHVFPNWGCKHDQLNIYKAQAHVSQQSYHISLTLGFVWESQNRTVCNRISDLPRKRTQWNPQLVYLSLKKLWYWPFWKADHDKKADEPAAFAPSESSPSVVVWDLRPHTCFSNGWVDELEDLCTNCWLVQAAKLLNDPSLLIIYWLKAPI